MKAREHAVRQAGVVIDEVSGKARRATEEEAWQLDSGVWHADPGFPEVPVELLRRERWVTALAGRWAFEEGILHLEARAQLWASAARWSAPCVSV